MVQLVAHLWAKSEYLPVGPELGITADLTALRNWDQACI